MYIYTPLCRYWITLYRYVLVFIVPHVDIELEDNKQFISNIPRTIQVCKQSGEMNKTCASFDILKTLTWSLKYLVRDSPKSLPLKTKDYIQYLVMIKNKVWRYRDCSKEKISLFLAKLSLVGTHWKFLCRAIPTNMQGYFWDGPDLFCERMFNDRMYLTSCNLAGALSEAIQIRTQLFKVSLA